LFLGLEASIVARNYMLRKKFLKVPPAEIAAVLEKVEGALDDDKALRSLFESFASKLGWPKSLPHPRAALEFPAWMLSLYRGPLDSKSLGELGLTAVT
jgi:hypothetical protein